MSFAGNGLCAPETGAACPGDSRTISVAGYVVGDKVREGEGLVLSSADAFNVISGENAGANADQHSRCFLLLMGVGHGVSFP
jgi:hypothetical protein